MITYFLIILYNILDMFTIPLVGQLKLNEIMALAVLPFCYRSNEFTKYPILRKICLTLLALLTFQVITDIFATDTASFDYLRGWSQSIIGIVSVIFLFKILNGYKAITLYLATSVIGALFSDPMGIELENANEMTFFKFRVAPVLTQVLFVVAIFLHYKGKQKIIPFLFLFFGLFCFYMDSRSRGLIMIFSSFLLYLFYSGFKFHRAYVIGGLIASAVIFQSLYIVYVNATLEGKFGGEHAASQLARIKNPYNPINLLTTGRGETFAAVEAIKDEPIFGHGSWAKDKTLKYYRIVLKYHNEKFEKDKAKIDGKLIPSHSFFMGAWVNYGVFAFLSVVVLFFLLLKMGIKLIREGQSQPIYPIFIPITVNMVWMFMFSTFQIVRFSIPDIVAIFLTSYYLLLQKQNQTKPEPEKDRYSLSVVKARS